MECTIQAHFDGSSIVPDEAVDFPVGQKMRVSISLQQENTPPHSDAPQIAAVIGGAAPPHAHLLDLTRRLDGAPDDLAEQHDHYLYGTPKR